MKPKKDHFGKNMGQKMFDDYFNLQEQIHKYFGYQEDWKVIPLVDHRADYWRLDGDGITYSDDKKALERNDDSNIYVSEIYTQRFLPKYIYRGEDYTMVCMDTMVDMNKWLGIFRNDMEMPGSYSEYDVDRNGK